MPTKQAHESLATLATKIDHIETTLKDIRNELKHLEQTFEQLMSKMAA